VYEQADSIISPGWTMTERLRSRGVAAEKIVTVHNWVPSEAVHSLPWGRRYVDGDRQFDGQFVVMHSGNMGMAHEFETILDAAELLKADNAILFVFAGDGKRRSEIVRESERRGLTNIRFMPPAPLGSLSRLLGSAAVHLVSMRQGVEGCLVPSKVYGIMAAARPAIMVGSTRNEVAALLRASGSGFTIVRGGAHELAAAIRQLRERPGLAARMGEAGRRYYERRLGRDRSVAAIVGVVTGEAARATVREDGQVFLWPMSPQEMRRAEPVAALLGVSGLPGGRVGSPTPVRAAGQLALTGSLARSVANA
jgi:colanic acid biosynthesis glycosyl transferase WcaI